MLSEKKILNETKNHNPPFKLNGRSLSDIVFIFCFTTNSRLCINTGADPGGAHPAPPSNIVKNMIFWRKIVIFHTEYPTNFRASLRSAQFF